jgi:hypothetical protein
MTASEPKSVAGSEGSFVPISVSLIGYPVPPVSVSSGQSAQSMEKGKQNERLGQGANEEQNGCAEG